LTPAALFYAIRRVSPGIGTTLALAIANQSLGYGRAYGVAPEVVAALIIKRNGKEQVDGISFLAMAFAGWVAGKAPQIRTYLRQSAGLAAELKNRAAAAGADVRRYGAE